MIFVICVVAIAFNVYTKNAFGGAMDLSSIGVKSWMMAGAVTGIVDGFRFHFWDPEKINLILWGG